jgi:homoserine O-succinyltransferase/O-acetyltransferase
MTARGRNTRLRTSRREFGGTIEPNGDVLTIAVVNNMPDSALRATERQFCALLGAASEGRLLRLQFFSLPGIKRSAVAAAHVARYYEDFAELQRNPPDGIIVTGTEPRAATLQEEPYWPTMAWLVDWAEEFSIPGIWSCLAAHAAVLRLSNIKREAFGNKLLGVFECKINDASHWLLQGLPERWQVPHSRFYGLSEAALVSHGYSILSRSAETGPDIFVKRTHGLQLFFQGHPEYAQSSLLGEYRRDIARFLSGERSTYPDMPRNYFDPSTVSALESFRERVHRLKSAEMLAEFDALAAGTSPENCWFDEADVIYANWLSYLADCKLRRILDSQFLKDQDRPINLAA